MALESRLGITDSAELARKEEALSKRKARELFESGFLDTLTPGTFEALAQIHAYLFSEIYEFAGKLRTVNLAKGQFRFAPVMYLSEALRHIDEMPQRTFDEIVEKYVEMNIAHPFREGNGRATREFMRLLFLKNGYEVDWAAVPAEDLLDAMEWSVYDTEKLQDILRKCLIEKQE